MPDAKSILNFIFELGMLRRIKHEGWRVAGVPHPESVAEHSLRAAQIAFLLAKMENHPTPYEVVTITIFHDIGECRIGDLHKIAIRYVKVKEHRAVSDQTKTLKKIGAEIFDLWNQIEGKKPSKSGIIAKDADLLEQAVMAREYIEQGFKFAEDWIKNIALNLKTNSAKKLLAQLKNTDSHDWWQKLKKPLP